MNPSTALACVLVDELARAGVTDAVLAPGSRSAPLAMALHAEARIRLHVEIDERSAAFLAVGLAKAGGRPAAVVSTSGTATANFHPAVVEADHARVPLLVLTADRPPELRHTAANQTIDQIKLYGSNVRWFVEVGAPDPSGLEVGAAEVGAGGLASAVPYWRSLAARAVATARGRPPGPVHLNLAFREPLVPDADEGPGNGLLAGRPAGRPWTVATPAKPALAEETVHALTERVAGAKRGLLVVGDTTAAPAPLLALAAAAGWPVIAEPLSGARAGDHAISTAHHLLASPTFAADHRPDLVLRVGRIGLSKPLLAFLDAGVPQVLVDPDGVWLDPTRVLDEIVTADPGALCAAVAARLPAHSEPVHSEPAHSHPVPADPALADPALADRAPVDRAPADLAPADPAPAESAWLRAWRDAEHRARGCLDALLDAGDEPSEPRTARDLAAALPDGSVLVAASSMPVRDLDQFMAPRAGLRVLGNRGASGIDGFVSTALGVALATDGPAAALAGDLSVLHDQNGFLLAERPDLVLVVINNDGGGIFSFLPPAQHRASFETLFGTPHGIDLAGLAGVYGLAHTRIERAGDLVPAVDHHLAGGGVTLVEVRTQRPANVALHRRLTAAIVEELDR